MHDKSTSERIPQEEVSPSDTPILPVHKGRERESLMLEFEYKLS